MIVMNRSSNTTYHKKCSHNGDTAADTEGTGDGEETFCDSTGLR